MLPLDPRFRKMVHKYIPQLNPHDLNRYECLLAYYWQLAQERDIIQNNVPDDRNPHLPKFKKKQAAADDPKTVDELSGRMKQVIEEANTILKPYANSYNSVVDFWNAHGRLAVQQRNFFQLPNPHLRNKAERFKEYNAYFQAMKNYGKVQRQTFRSRLTHRIEHLVHSLSRPRVILVAAAFALFSVAFYFFYRLELFP